MVYIAPPVEVPRRKRRVGLIVTVALIPVLLIAGCAAIANLGQLIPGLRAAEPVDTVGTLDFDHPLAIPPLAESTVDADGTRVIPLEAQAGTSVFRDGLETPTAGYNGAYLGPTIMAKSGEHLRVDLTNSLDEPTTIHWHGMHLPASEDGGPHQMVEPGAERSAEWTVDQPAATLWYHPHPHGETEEQVGRGLAGLFYVQDEAESALPLPSSYGVDDIPVVVQDVVIGEDGAMDDDNRGFVGALGKELLVNGTIAPFFEVTSELTRIRLVNASPARSYDFGFDDSRSFAMIASDGGLLEAPFDTDHIRLSPGERAEIVVRMSAGEQLILRSNPPELGLNDVPAGANGGTDRFDVLQLRAAATLSAGTSIPSSLSSIEKLDESDAATTRQMNLDGYVINNEPMRMDRIDEVVTVDTTEIWEVRNGMQMPHNFHVHDVQFQLLSIDGEKPGPELSGRKDTIFLEPQKLYRIIMRFEDYTDPDLPYMYHCHLLAHEDLGMMGQFVVVEKGEEAGTPPEHHESSGTHSDTDTAIGYGPRDEGAQTHEH